MILNFVPLIMIAGFGYLIYQWCLSTGARQAAKRRAKAAANMQASGNQYANSKPNDKAIAATAGNRRAAGAALGAGAAR